ncbi:nuclear transport factor 2 family protein [Mesorhizobium sp.]|uniref:nuclear transport factor 2 family protein n=1 Tax=Mesorhizobium sp. TaxID=1871066 RepID=UPI000FE7FC7F|nr:nuclear transport factor 2 family protein [Mesorhizobium sp.]RWO98997.1 MAG: nuclear transport factor 2 family protein [Mesorhizobium sp.]
MTQTAPLDIATAFTKAWTSHDLEKAASLVADDVVFDGPMQQSTGMIAAFGDDHQALLMYDLVTKSSGALSCAKHLTISDGKIHSDKLTFDSKKLGSAKPRN